MKKIVIIASVFLLLASCQTSEYNSNELDRLDWLLGEWTNIQVESEFYEIWSSVNDSVFYGESYLIKEEDTVFFETMLLEQKGSDLLLTPTTMNQNEGNSITFKLISDSSEVYIFENKKHDFPQRIVYTNPQADSLYAYIEGEENGEYRKAEFPFKRKKH